jgi:peptidoglycan DL-endopeptidase CwlO
MSSPLTRSLRPLRLLLPFFVIGLALMLFLTVGFLAFSPNLGSRDRPSTNCDAGIGTVGEGSGGGATIETLSPEQRRNASAIIGVAKERGAPPRAWLVALATAMQESTLRNINYGDRDSLGLFQQRPSQGWGSPAEVTDPRYSTGIFLDRLLALPGWEQMPVTEAAQTVQRSAFPDAYAKWEGLAVQLVEQVGDISDPTGCGTAPTGALPRGAAGAAIGFALREVGKPYVWGATGPDAYDCSGLTMASWAQAGVALPHSSSAQYSSGPQVPASALQPGDLVFYYSPISHVGMYIGNGMIVHAANPSTGVQTTGLYSMPYSGAVRPG